MLKLVNKRQKKQGILHTKYFTIKCLLIIMEIKINLPVDKSCKHHLNQVTKVTSPVLGKTEIMYHLTGCSEKNTASTL